MTQTRIVTLSGDPERESQVAAELSAAPGFELVLRCVDRIETLAAIRGGRLDVALCVGAVRWFDFQCLEEARAAGIHLVGLADDPIEVELLEVTGFDVLEPGSGLDSLACRGEASPSEPPSVRPEGRLLAVWGPKGSPGRTTISIELAHILSAAGHQTLLADSDLYGGDILQLLGLADDTGGIVAAARGAARGETADDAWSSGLRRLPNDGPAVLTGLIRADLWSEVSLFGWKQLISRFSARFDYAICDVGFCLESTPHAPDGRGRNDLAIATVEAADRILAVFRADPVGLRSLVWSMRSTPDLFPPDGVMLVANRVRPGEAREVSALVRRHLGRYPVVTIPDRPDLTARAAWAGEPISRIAPDSSVSQAIRDLAGALGGSVPARGFLSRLLTRSAGA